MFDYTTGKILSLVILYNLNKLHLIIYYFYKMIFTKNCHKTPDGKLCPILEIFKI